MKLLMVTPYLPYPPVSGGQTRSYHLITRLAKKHKITLFCYYRHEDERQFVKHLEPFVEKVVLVKRRPVLHPFHILLGIFSSMPFLLVSTYFSRTLSREIQRELDSQEYDLIHCETFYVTPNIPLTSIPIILAEQTVEYYVYEHFVQHLPSIFRGLFWLELKKLLHWEKAMWQRAQRILTVSLEDKK
ncbi:MAG: glycosyltransferase, partial [Candidatus Roizmanbacteria bacterium]|nr:glycosyltransferase [Candidatus Roizmanbacteria bacterium]